MRPSAPLRDAPLSFSPLLSPLVIATPYPSNGLTSLDIARHRSSHLSRFLPKKHVRQKRAEESVANPPYELRIRQMTADEYKAIPNDTVVRAGELRDGTYPRFHFWWSSDVYAYAIGISRDNAEVFKSLQTGQIVFLTLRQSIRRPEGHYLIACKVHLKRPSGSVANEHVLTQGNSSGSGS